MSILERLSDKFEFDVRVSKKATFYHRTTISEKLNTSLSNSSRSSNDRISLSSDINTDCLFRTENRRNNAMDVSKSDERNRGSGQTGPSKPSLGDFQFTFAFSLADDVPSRTTLLPVAFSLPPCSTFADHARAHLICDRGKKRRRESSKTRNRCGLDVGKKIDGEGDIYYRWPRNYRPSFRSVLRHGGNAILGTKLLASLCASSEKRSGDLIPSAVPSAILAANKGLKISMPIMAFR